MRKLTIPVEITGGRGFNVIENKVDVSSAGVTILMEINGEVHLTAMTKENYETVSLIAKSSTEHAISTEVTQNDLRKFLGVDD